MLLLFVRVPPKCVIACCDCHPLAYSKMLSPRNTPGRNVVNFMNRMHLAQIAARWHGGDCGAENTSDSRPHYAPFTTGIVMCASSQDWSFANLRVGCPWTIGNTFRSGQRIRITSKHRRSRHARNSVALRRERLAPASGGLGCAARIHSILATLLVPQEEMSSN